MSDARTCSECGTPLNNDAAEGFCPACMLQGALALGRVGAPSPTASKPVFGDYQLLEEIARGGMGVVYRARQVSLDRIVALKLILAGRLANIAAIRRFRAEAGIAARLRHPNIVAIHEVGEEAGQHFFSMDYVDGPNLADFARQHPISTRKAASLLKTIAQAIHYAHGEGIVHRDLKPSNILIDGAFEPRVTDFGLARNLKADLDLTLTGQVLGSPNYISPEQASGKGTVGVASDIYSLGAILYHLLSGRPPFAAETLTDTLQQVTTKEAVSPRLLNPSVPKDLETICLKCLEKDPGKRYVTAAHLAEDVGRFLDDAPIAARPVSKAERAWRWCRRKPVVAVLVLAVIVSTVIGCAGVVLQWRQSEVHRRLAEQKARESARNLYAADMVLAQAALESGNTGHAEELLRKYMPKMGEQDLRGWEWRYVWAQSRGDELFTLQSSEATISALALSTNGTLLAAGYRDGRIILWDLSNRHAIKTLTQSGAVHGLAFARHDKELIVGTSHGQVSVLSCESWQPVVTLTKLSHVRALKVSPDGKFLAVWGMKFLTIHGLSNYDEIARIPVLRENYYIPAGLAFSPDSSILAYSRGDGAIVLWDLLKRERIGELNGHGRGVTAIAFSVEGDTLASASRDRTVRIWDVGSRKELRQVGNGGFPSWIGAVAFSPEGGLLAIIGAGQRVRLFETRGWEEVNNLKGHKEEIWSAVFASDGRTLLTGGKDGSIKCWAVPTDQELHYHPLPPDVIGYVLSARAEVLLTTHTDGTYSIWRTDPLEEVANYSFPIKATASTISPDGRYWAAATTNDLLRIFDHQQRQFVAEMAFPGSMKSKLAYSPDGQLLAGVGNDLTCRVWRVVFNIESRAESQGLAEPSISEIAAFQINSAAAKVPKFSSSGRLVGIITARGKDEIWNIDRGCRVAALPSDMWSTEDIAFSQNDSIAATASAGGKVNLWDLKTSRRIAELGGQLNTTFSVAVSPDDRRLVACGGDGTVKLWDMESKQEVANLRIHDSNLQRVAFSSDGERIFVLGGDRFFVLRAPTNLNYSFAKHGGGLPPALMARRSQLLKNLGRTSEAVVANLAAFNLSQRDSETPPTLIDLSLFYNMSFEGLAPWRLKRGGAPNLQKGTRHFDEVEFDVRGAIRLAADDPASPGLPFPPAVEGIEVRQKCRRLHFLHFAFGQEKDGVQVASYLVRFAGTNKWEIPVRYGDHVRTWVDRDLRSPVKSANSAVAWTGTSNGEMTVRLFRSSWDNPRPDDEIDSIDLVSTMSQSWPVLVAITLER